MKAINEFLQQLARMETAEEYDERTNDDGMSGDDAVDAISGVIRQARELLAAQNQPTDALSFYKWTVEFAIAPVWVADGFNLTTERAQRMIQRELGWATAHEVSAVTLHAPDDARIATEQGYTSVKAMKASR